MTDPQTIRALAFEEAARVCDSAQELADVTSIPAPHSVVAETIREKAPLPPSLVAVDREVLEKVREALSRVLDTSAEIIVAVATTNHLNARAAGVRALAALDAAVAK